MRNTVSGRLGRARQLFGVTADLGLSCDDAPHAGHCGQQVHLAAVGVPGAPAGLAVYPDGDQRRIVITAAAGAGQVPGGTGPLHQLALTLKRPWGTGARDDGGAVGVGDGADDGQAESVSFAVADPLDAELPERLEQVLHRIWRDQRAGVSRPGHGLRRAERGREIHHDAGDA